MGFSILPRNRLCSIIISGFRVGFRGLSPYSFGIRFHHLFWFRVGFRGLSPYSFGIRFQHLFWFRVGFRGLSPYSFGIRFHHLLWFRVGFRGLSPYSFGIRFHNLVPQTALNLNGVLNSSKKQALFHHHSWFWLGHPFLVPRRVPPVPSSFPGPGSAPCLPAPLASCYIIISWSRLGFRGLSPYSFGILLHHPFLVPTRVRDSFGVLFPHHFLVPARVPGLVSLLFWYPVTSSFLGSG